MVSWCLFSFFRFFFASFAHFHFDNTGEKETNEKIWDGEREREKES